MASSGQDSSPPPAGERPPRKPRSFTPLAAMRAQVHEGAKELVVDDFVDTYFQERPKTLPPISPIGAEPPPPPAEPGSDAWRAAQAGEESGVRKAVGGQVAAIEVSFPDDEGLVVMEAELADRDDKISTLEDELERLRGEIGELRSTRGVDLALAPPEPEASPAPSSIPVSAPTPAATPPVDHPPAAAASPPIAKPPAARKRGPSGARLAVGVLLAVAAIASIAIAVNRTSTERPPAVETASPTVASSPVVPEPSPEEAKAIRPARDTHGPTAIEPTAIPTAGTAPTAAPAATPAADPAPSTEPAPALLSFQALLTVASSVDAEVVVQGQSVGRTNQRLLTRCGPRNVRLRQEGAWISPGEHVRIVCMEHTQIRVDPTK